MGELMKMKQEGKIRAIGASNVDLRILQDYVDAGQLDVIQEKLSILDRKPENIPLVNGMLAGWRDLTEKYHCTLANLAAKWNSMLSPNIHVLCGARKLSQIEDNAQSLDVPLTQEDFLRMKADADALTSRCV